ncbi:MAG: YafY family transcriptional regulator [Spirochaetaceae bacterium]|nr:YafY family transcriptional regulator [Spirochaetaceae bacterium]
MKQREEKVKTLRLMEIDRMIRDGLYPNATTLGKKLEVSRSTIARDIDFLRDRYLAPIEYSQEKNGYYYTDSTFFIKSVMLSEGELFSISAITPLLEQYKNTPLENSFRNILSKIIDMLPEQVSVDTLFVTKEISFISDPLPRIDEEVFNSIFKAIKTFSKVEFMYRSLSKQEYNTRSLNPYHVVCQKGNWYVLGWCHKYKSIRVFALSRIKNILVTEQKFDVPVEFNPEKFIDPSLGIWVNTQEPVKIELLFSANINTYILERNWHTTQEIKQNQDGSVYLSFLSNQMQETLHWVMSFGSSVKILNPPELIQQVKSEAEKMMCQY